MHCPVCQSAIASDEPHGDCPSCKTPHHVECWQMNEGCAVYGCDHVPDTEHRSELDIPVSYWGQEHKACPACGQEILASAKRCRHCGAMFADAKPETTESFKQAKKTEKSLPKIRKGVVVLFIFNVITCSAPLAALIGLFWYLGKKEQIKKLPALYPALARIGLGLGFLQTILFIVLAVTYSLTHGG